MSKKFFITTESRQQVRKLLTMKGDDQAVSFDFSSWSEDNADVTTATWTTESGSASIDGQGLFSNIASARITTAEAGSSQIKLSVTDGTHTKNVYLKVVAKDPGVVIASDYGLAIT